MAASPKVQERFDARLVVLYHIAESPVETVTCLCRKVLHGPSLFLVRSTSRLNASLGSLLFGILPFIKGKIRQCPWRYLSYLDCSQGKGDRWKRWKGMTIASNAKLYQNVHWTVIWRFILAVMAADLFWTQYPPFALEKNKKYAGCKKRSA